MKRVGWWKVALLVALTGVVAGFTRLESLRNGVPNAQAPPCPTSRPMAAEHEAERGRQCLKDLVGFLREMGQGGGRPVQSLPPLDRLPPLPADLLPAEDGPSDPL